jgi:thioredoxin family protein
MVLCLIALPIFMIIGIFSIKYRKLSKDAFECLFKTVTLKKCKNGLDDRIKSRITGTILKHSPKLAKLVYKYYKILSWIILIIFIWSAYEGSIGVYNYINYGNCNGPESVGFCMLDPLGESSGISEIDCTEHDHEIQFPLLEKDDPIIGSKEAQLTIIEFGCYTCSFTKNIEPTVKQILRDYDGIVNIQIKNFYIPQHSLSYESALAINCAHEQGKYMEFHEFLMNTQKDLNANDFFEVAKEYNLDMDQFSECYNTDKYKKEIDSDTLMGIHAGVIGTPTFFINEHKIVGTKPYKTFKKIIDQELKK